MNCKIVYLEPRNSFRNPLRSDTLFGTLCWAISMVHGNKTLDTLLKEYHEKGNTFPFFISSAFPYLEKDKQKICFLPRPIDPVKTVDIETSRFEQERLELRKWKKSGKRKYAAVSHFEYEYCETEAPNNVASAPKFEVLPITHNTINRLTGGTLTINDKGQLFHTEEYFLKSTSAEKQVQKMGMYFLLKSEDAQLELLQGALRFLEHYGVGGDRSTGKGRFKISGIEDFELREPKKANAVMTLSLYYPTVQERQLIQGSNNKVLNYKMEPRMGWKTGQKGALKTTHLLFQEGSIFPIIPSKQDLIYGESPLAGRHDAGFDITRYGFGFMINVKIH